MDYVEFGAHKTRASRIVLGLMRIAGMGQADIDALIDAALGEGINALDLADCYADGTCERVLGDCIARRPELRSRVWIQSKCGIRKDADFTYYDFSKEHILASVDGILSRLKVDHLDSLLLHRPDALMEPDEIAEAFTALHTAGKVLDFGVSNCNPAQLALLSAALPFPIAANQVQLSCAFTPALDAGFQVNMMWDGSVMREGGVLEYCRLHGIAVQSWSSLQYGFFEGTFLGSPKYPELNAVLDRIAAEHGVPSTAVALAWVLRYPGKMQAVIGTTKPERVRESAAATNVALSRKEWYEIYLAAGNKLP